MDATVAPDLLAALDVLHHVLVGLVGSVDTRFRSLDGQRKGVHNDYRVADDFALHQTHNLVRHARSRMDDLGTRSIGDGQSVSTRGTILMRATADILHDLKKWGLERAAVRLAARRWASRLLFLPGRLAIDASVLVGVKFVYCILWRYLQYIVRQRERLERRSRRRGHDGREGCGCVVVCQQLLPTIYCIALTDLDLYEVPVQLRVFGYPPW